MPRMRPHPLASPTDISATDTPIASQACRERRVANQTAASPRASAPNSGRNLTDTSPDIESQPPMYAGSAYGSSASTPTNVQTSTAA